MLAVGERVFCIKGCLVVEWLYWYILFLSLGEIIQTILFVNISEWGVPWNHLVGFMWRPAVDVLERSLVGGRGAGGECWTAVRLAG